MPRINMLTNKAFRFVINNDTGATAIEYGLLAALISVVIIAAVTLVGTELKAVFAAVSTALAAAL
jgi:pilus assembly protein Flp/PilA